MACCPSRFFSPQATNFNQLGPSTFVLFNGTILPTGWPSRLDTLAQTLSFSLPSQTRVTWIGLLCRLRYRLSLWIFPKSTEVSLLDTVITPVSHMYIFLSRCLGIW